MNIPNRRVVCDVLIELAAKDRDIVVVCSDSGGSGCMTPFACAFPDQFVEVGIAEQSLVSVAAGLANGGKKPVAVSPACFLSTRGSRSRWTAPTRAATSSCSGFPAA